MFQGRYSYRAINALSLKVCATGHARVLDPTIPQLFDQTIGSDEPMAKIMYVSDAKSTPKPGPLVK